MEKVVRVRKPPSLTKTVTVAGYTITVHASGVYQSDVALPMVAHQAAVKAQRKFVKVYMAEVHGRKDEIARRIIAREKKATRLEEKRKRKVTV